MRFAFPSVHSGSTVSQWFVLLLLSFSAVTAAAQEPTTPTNPAQATDAATDAALAQPETPTGSSPDPSAENASDAAAVVETVAVVDEGLVARFNRAMEPVNERFGEMNGHIASVIFYPIPLGGENTIPAAVLVLILGAIFFTVHLRFINIRGFWHAIVVTMGKYDNKDDQGEVTHFQALSAALSATVGLGNIAGVAIAICTGGPGATLWMVLAGFLGMSSKFAECTLGQKYREERPDGRIMGGAMYYLSRGLGELGLPRIGKVLAVMFAILCVGGSFAGGNSFQVKMSLGAVGQTIPFLAAPEVAGDADYRWIYGLAMTIVTGAVIIGGIRRIASAAEKIVPAMCGIYCLAAAVILIKNAALIPDALSQIFTMAFTGKALGGGLLGTLIVGFQRAAFSNEAGVGSAAIAHAAAKTEYPIREGIVALLEPFIDTVIICTMSALMIVITGAWVPENSPEFAKMIEAKNGAGLMSLAMDGEIPGFRYVLSITVVLFAFSTMISWSYYGERCWAYLFGDGASMSYRIIFLIFTFLGSILSSTNVLDFGDLMIFGMAVPNIIGLVLLSGKIKRDLDAYLAKLHNGEFTKN